MNKNYQMMEDEKFLCFQSIFGKITYIDDIFLNNIGFNIIIMRAYILVNKYYCAKITTIVDKKFGKIIHKTKKYLCVPEIIQFVKPYVLDCFPTEIIETPVELNINDITPNLMFWYSCKYNDLIFCKYLNCRNDININLKIPGAYDDKSGNEKYQLSEKEWDPVGYPFFNALFAGEIDTCDWLLSLPDFDKSKIEVQYIKYWILQDRVRIPEQYHMDGYLQLKIAYKLHNLDKKYIIGIFEKEICERFSRKIKSANLIDPAYKIYFDWLLNLNQNYIVVKKNLPSNARDDLF
jgi:hypothetical protein